MLTYNTQLRPLRLPEYGRNIQQMVDYCLEIPDREERTVCAYSIVDSMAALFPELKEQGGQYNHKLWDHLMIMSDFRLDIDFPCEVIQADSLTSRPTPLPYDTGSFAFRHYGRNIEYMINVASEMQPGEERDELIRMIAYQMKKLMLASTGDAVDDARIFKDLAVMSHGAIRISPEEMKLRDIIAPPKPATGKKRKKK